MKISVLLLLLLVGTLVPKSVDEVLDPEQTYPPRCYGGPHVLVVYARSIHAQDNHEANASAIRQAAVDANSWFHDRSYRFTQHHADLRLACDASGNVTVHHAAVDLPKVTDYWDVVAALDPLRNENTTLWVAWDGSNAKGSAGTAHRYEDDSPEQTNLNNQGGSVAVIWRADGKGPWLHELLHALGAVQASAPNSTGKGHCTDASDILCYNDGGAAQRSVCGAPRRLDCNNDDYYHPAPAEGSYLASHWNLANSKFVDVR